MESALYNDFGNWLKERFPFKIQKISIDAGFSCPNRDGKLSFGGCSFCDNRTFNPSYCSGSKSVKQQIEEGKAFFARKYKGMKYLAYFQAFTNTYAPLDKLKELYEEALSIEDVEGIVIGTRPDCVSDELLDYLEQLNQDKFVLVEYGIESANNNTLKRINRGHTFECSQDAIERTNARGIMTGGHIIIGLPGEDKDETISQAKKISDLKIDLLKIHQLQVIRGTRLEKEYQTKPFHLYTMDEYIETVENFLQHLRSDIILDRFVSQSPSELLVAPKWGIKNHEFVAKLKKHMASTGAYQGQFA